MRAVRSLFEVFRRYSIELKVCEEFGEDCKVFDLVGSCKEFVRRIARYSIELGVVRRMLRRNVRYVIDLRSVRSLLGEMRGIR